jgi:uncharacterized RDD family membrane protein YckC
MRTDRFKAPHSARLTALEGVPLARFRARAGAFLVDLLLVILIVAVLELPSIFSQLRAGAGAASMTIEVGDYAGLVALIAYFTLATYFGRGQTIGKRLFRIRVISLVHDRLDLWHSFERALGYAASTLEAGFGFFQYFIHPNRQTVHDRIAETVVIVANRRRSPEGTGVSSDDPFSRS